MLNLVLENVYHATVDTIFALQSIIQKTLKSKKKMYCCFVDYKKAFELVDRSKLWSKLIKKCIRGKPLI